MAEKEQKSTIRKKIEDAGQRTKTRAKNIWKGLVDVAHGHPHGRPVPMISGSYFDPQRRMRLMGELPPKNEEERKAAEEYKKKHPKAKGGRLRAKPKKK